MLWTFIPKTDMIALHQFDEQQFAKSWHAYANDVFTKALTEVNGGVLPSEEELVEHAKIFITEDKTHLLTWKHPKIKVGEAMDEKYVIATVSAPNIFKPKPPQ